MKNVYSIKVYSKLRKSWEIGLLESSRQENHTLYYTISMKECYRVLQTPQYISAAAEWKLRLVNIICWVIAQVPKCLSHHFRTIASTFYVFNFFIKKSVCLFFIFTFFSKNHQQGWRNRLREPWRGTCAPSPEG